MAFLTQDLLVRFGAKASRAQLFLDPLNAAAGRYCFDTAPRMAAFVGQVFQETDCLAITIESMNYSAAGLLGTFPKHFTKEEAAAYERQPERIGARAYADRMGNGPESSGDGWRYRGRGLLQLTGKDDYRDCGLGLGLDLLSNPDKVTEPETAAAAAGWEWNRGKLNQKADAGDFKGITLTINGGLNGYAGRVAYYERAKSVLGIC